MRTTSMVAACAAFAAVAACSAGQGGAGRGPEPSDSAVVARAASVAPPVVGIIGHREALKLTSAQVTTLDSIDQALRAENAPLRARVEALQDSIAGHGRQLSGGQRRTLLRRGAPILEELRTNNQRAAARVHEMLTPEQRTQVCDLLQPRRNADRGRGRVDPMTARNPGQPGRMRPVRNERPGVRPESALFWCPRPEPPQRDTAAAAARPAAR